MSENDEVEEVNEEVEGHDDSEVTATEADTKLAEAEATITRLNAIVNDADVSALLSAKEEKKPIRIVIGDVTDEEDGEEEELAPLKGEDLDVMGNSQLADTLLKRVEQMVSRGLKGSELNSKLTLIEKEINSSKQEKLLTSAKALAEKYPDLMEHKAELVQLASSGLNLEEAYLVSRMRKGKGLPVAKVQRTSAESPTSVIVRSSKKVQPARAGARGFAQDLEEVLNRMDMSDDN